MKNRWFIIAFAAVFPIATQGFAQSNANLNYALQQAAQEAKANKVEKIDAENDLTQQIKDSDYSTLRQFQKSNETGVESTLHKVLYFPKDTGITEDDRRSDPTYGVSGGRFDVDADQNGKTEAVLGKPSLYYITAPFIDTCKNAGKMYDQGQFSRKYNFGFWFADKASKPAEDAWCAVLWIRLDPTVDSPANRLKGAIGQVKVYVDSSYKTYGIEKWTFATDRDREPSFDTVESVIDTSQEDVAVIHSAFDGLPIAIPNLTNLSKVKQVNPKAVATVAIDTFAGSHEQAELELNEDQTAVAQKFYDLPNFPQDPYLVNKLEQEEFARYAACEGAGLLIKYQARFGVGRQTVGWCKGDALPLYVENETSLTVLVRKAQQ